MQELTSEEEACLKELVDVYERDESTSEFVSNRLFGELKEGTREFNRQKRIYETLSDKGFTIADSYYEFGADADTELTSKGRCYFRDRQLEAASNKRLHEEQWRHDRRVEVIGGICGLFSGALGGWLITTVIPELLRALSR